MGCDVLVLEDDPQLLELSVALLRDEGFLVREARSAAEAVQAFGEDGPAVLVTDLHLGEERTGIDVAEELCRASPDLGVVFLTGRIDLLENRLAGARQKVLRKPFKARQLAEMVMELIEGGD